MNEIDLQKLSSAVDYLLNQESFSRTVERLKGELALPTETFVWETIDLDTIPCEQPAGIKSCWVFHLRRDVPSGSYYHPNSVKHMVLVGGQGTSNVGGLAQTDYPFYIPGVLIRRKVPHHR